MNPRTQKDVFFETIYEIYYKKLENQCLNYVGYSKEYLGMIEDSVQETFLKAIEDYEVLSTYPPSLLEAWLRKTCKNRLGPALRKCRYRKRYHVSLPEDDSLYLSHDQISQAMDNIIDKIADQECIDRIFAALNNRERKLLDMRYQQGMSFEDIAAHENTTTGAVKGVLARVNSKVKKDAKKNPNKYFILTVSILFIEHFNR